MSTRLTKQELKQRVLATIDERREEVIALGQDILRHPEVGYTEQRTSGLVKEWYGRLGIPFQDGLALTGVRGLLEGGAGPGPAVGLLGELDSLRVPDHPFADQGNGAAHACGHHVQIASLMGSLIGLKSTGVMDSLAGRVIPFAVPAEEFIDLEWRLKLKEEGKIEFLGGKQELIKRDEFRDMQMALHVHTRDLEGPLRLSVGGTCNGHVAKFVRFIGRGSHAGALPHLGTNALNAAVIAINAMHANRETFRDADTVRFHGIISRGGEAVSAVPSDVRLEWRVRAGNLDAVRENNRKLDRSFKAGAMAVGARVVITTIPGYLPIRNDITLKETFAENATDLVGREGLQVVPEEYNRGHSTDFGDLSHVMPVLGVNVGGVEGRGHGNDYLVTDWDNAVVDSAKSMALTVIDLLYDDAARAKEVLDRSQPAMTREAYLALQRERAQETDFDGSAE